MAKKIASKTVIKEVSGKADGVKMKFGNFNFIPGQVEGLINMAKSKDAVRVTIEKWQENLPGTE